MSFVALPDNQKAEVMMEAAIRAASRYYKLSAGVHFDESGVEHFIQSSIWEAICDKSGPQRTFASMETSPVDVLSWAGVKDHTAIFAELEPLLDTRSRFDLVLFAEANDAEYPFGIVEVKVRRKAEEFAHDISRIFEFA